MAEFWVGIKGDLSVEQIEALRPNKMPAYDLRKSAAAWGTQPPLEWATLRTFVLVAAEDPAEAKAEVAEMLDLEADDLVAYSGEVFK